MDRLDLTASVYLSNRFEIRVTTRIQIFDLTLYMTLLDSLIGTVVQKIRLASCVSFFGGFNPWYGFLQSSFIDCNEGTFKSIVNLNPWLQLHEASV